MRRTVDWTPAVLITASCSVTVVLIVLLTTPWIRARLVGGAGPERARRQMASQVPVWVGPIAPSVKGVLSDVWGDLASDREHDLVLRAELGLPPDADLAFYHLLLFNLSDEERTVELGDGALRVMPRDADGAGGVVTLRSLAALARAGDARPTSTARAVLGPRGVFHDAVKLPAGMMADLLVAFERRVDLDGPVTVASADGTAFHRRRMPRRDFEALIEAPDAGRLRDL